MTRGALAIAILVAATRAASADVEVCPLLDAARPISAFWTSESLWPSCPLSSPIQSIGGRCVGGASAHCMQPCASTFDSPDTKGTTKYTYDAAGNLLTATATAGSAFDDQKCERDAHGNLTKCEERLGKETFTYRAGKLTRADLVTGPRTYTRDAKGRLVRELWQGKFDTFDVRYTYGKDGTLAKYTTQSGPKGKLTPVELKYDGGKLVGIHTQYGDVAYAYDDKGRVTTEDNSGSYVLHTTYKYDDQGRLVQVDYTTPHGLQVTTYQYQCQ